jgi:hypothetical protein
MWIFTSSGFISAVQDHEDRTIIVRSRDRASLESISSQFSSLVIATPLADYPYRLKLNSEQLSKWLADQASSINYRNFKSEVYAVRGSKFSKTLSKVWSVMHDVEDDKARRRDEI